MAHVGMQYPFLFERDLSICSVPMRRLPTHMKIPFLTLQLGPGLGYGGSFWMSEPGVASYTDGTVVYEFLPGWVTGGSVRAKFTYELTQLQLPLKIYWEMECNGGIGNQSWGPFQWDALWSFASSSFPSTTGAGGGTFCSWLKGSVGAVLWHEFP